MNIFAHMLDLLLPYKCSFCMRMIHRKNDGICDTCRKALPLTGTHKFTKGDFYTTCVSPLFYEDDVRQSLRRYKFSGKISYYKTYTPFLLECIEESYGNDYDIITWVPVSRRRLNQRGYDQSQLLAEAISKRLGTKATVTLKKRKHTKAQSKVGSMEKRKANISGAYTAINPELYENKTVLLIDDIITTGSTMSECAKTLMMAGAKTIKCATVARKPD